MKSKRVTGVGGIFFRAKDPKTLRAWYAKHLGMQPADWGGVAFRWRQDSEKVPEGYTVWSPFGADSKYMMPGRKDFMKALKRESVQVLDRYEDIENGNFGYVLDPDGILIELWEPNPDDPTLAPTRKSKPSRRR